MKLCCDKRHDFCKQLTYTTFSEEYSLEEREKAAVQ